MNRSFIYRFTPSISIFEFTRPLSFSNFCPDYLSILRARGEKRGRIHRVDCTVDCRCVPNKFPSTNCFVITYIYVDAYIDIASILSISRHGENVHSVLYFYSFLYSSSIACSNYVIPCVIFLSNPSISTRYREERRGKRRERKVREALLFLRSFSNRIESNLVAFRRVEKRSGVRFFLVRFSARVENTRKSIEVVVFPVERREFFSQSRTIATPFPT